MRIQLQRRHGELRFDHLPSQSLGRKFAELAFVVRPELTHVPEAPLGGDLGDTPLLVAQQFPMDAMQLVGFDIGGFKISCCFLRKRS